ncbi:MAG TPA: GNAT family N-acetyltransferase [Bacteroidota bacterium]|nr:GNAT family N-acetyltransferase [Bacteroidota bacterium]
MSSSADIREALTPELVKIAQSLFREYADSIGVDLAFQDFARELEELPGKYAPLSGGLFMAFVDNIPAGCVALRGLAPPGIAELKRLYVRPQARGLGLGRLLTETAVQRALKAGYRTIRLDTLSTMVSARQLYQRMGFKEIPAYTFNPIPGAVYMELDLGAR